MPTARFSQPSICQHSHLKCFQQWYIADTGRCSSSLAVVDKDVGQASSGGERHITMWCFLSLIKKSLLWQTMTGKSWDEAHIFITEGSSLEQAAYLIQIFSVFMSYSSFDQRTSHYLVLYLFLQYLTGDFWAEILLPHLISEPAVLFVNTLTNLPHIFYIQACSSRNTSRGCISPSLHVPHYTGF